MISPILESAKVKALARLWKEGLLDKKVCLRAKVLFPEEAIGNPERDDYPLLKGKERIIEADFKGHLGHAFTDMHGGFEGTIQDIFSFEASNNYRRALQVATINALVHYWGVATDTVHCKDKQMEVCARKSTAFIQENYPDAKKIMFIGYQPALLKEFSRQYEIKILDLNKKNIGQVRFGTVVLDGEQDMKGAVLWADIVLATGSTIVNGTIDDIIAVASSESTVFYGVTIAGAAYFLNLKRMCFS